jgi:hypothetical protein
MQPAEVKEQLQQVINSFIGDHMTTDLCNRIKYDIAKKLCDLSKCQDACPVEVKCESTLYDSVTISLYNKTNGKAIASCAELMLIIGLITPEEAIIMQIMDS